jgi:hypothetical protein
MNNAAGIEVVKCSTWEAPFKERISVARGRELSRLLKVALLQVRSLGRLGWPWLPGAWGGHTHQFLPLPLPPFAQEGACALPARGLAESAPYQGRADT